MRIFKISCHSSCGTCFVVYLKSVTVVAADKAAALVQVQAWLTESTREFLRSDPTTWEVEELETSSHGVIDYHEDSDY